MKLFGFTSFDELLAYNCAPVLAGIKPANLLSLMPDDAEEIDALLVQYNAQFAERGIVFRRLCACTKRVLILVYNEEQLAQALRNPGYQAYLIAAGYEAGASAEDYLYRLEQRLNTQKTFPHEIGVFLGYPLEDILGFVLNKGTDCKYSGYWKVYGDVPKARSIFAAYERFRDIILQKLEIGRAHV